ncbi:MAG: pyruvate kinase [Xanthomonadales bacterium]|nr:pyruvate kinase [Xanthomonadales bacterium]
MTQRRRTKIIATVGPACESVEMLCKLIEAGVNVFRINLSHGSAEEQKLRAINIRKASARTGVEVGLLADLRGPKIRIEKFINDKVELQSGDTFIIDAGDPEQLGDETRVGVSYAGLPDDVRPADVLLLDDGLITMRVKFVKGRQVYCEVINGGTLSNRKGLNLSGGGLSIPGLADEDIIDVPLAAKMGVDYLAVSFPRNAGDMREARTLLRKAGSNASVISKIERVEAIENLESIIDASDAVLVARGDLGVEIGDAELPGLQKKIISTSLKQNRVVITATQMLQSMIDNPVPTRAEVLDIANAVIDGSDAVMLSAETAVGNYPVKAVEAMHRICLGAERHLASSESKGKLNVRFERIDQAIAMAAMFTAQNVSVQAIVSLTESGSTAKWLSRVSSPVPIFALSPNQQSRRKMALYKDVYPVEFIWEKTNTNSEIIDQAIQCLFSQGLLEAGQRVVFTMGERQGMKGGTNTLRLLEVNPHGSPEYRAELDYS